MDWDGTKGSDSRTSATAASAGLDADGAGPGRSVRSDVKASEVGKKGPSTGAGALTLEALGHPLSKGAV